MYTSIEFIYFSLLATPTQTTKRPSPNLIHNSDAQNSLDLAQSSLGSNRQGMYKIMLCDENLMELSSTTLSILVVLLSSCSCIFRFFPSKPFCYRVNCEYIFNAVQCHVAWALFFAHAIWQWDTFLLWSILSAAHFIAVCNEWLKQVTSITVTSLRLPPI